MKYPLASSQIHLWFLFEQDLRDESLLARYRDQLITTAEWQYAQRFHSGIARRRHLLARALLRSVLSRYLGDEPKHLNFFRNAWGRPELARAGGVSPLVFNLSHTDGLILLGVTTGTQLGVDVECIDPKKTPCDVAEQFFPVRETAWLDSLPSSLRAEHFYRLWTLKEAKLKADGKGWCAPLGRIEFAFPGDRSISVLSSSTGQVGYGNSRYWLIRPSARHVAALCADHSRRPQDLFMRATLPLVRDDPIDCEILGQSR